ncbi:tyrosine-type recombinase/integrase [Nitrosarchaeum sp.]|uniref:tyrosine-type recombinase/integrase n=1 Tax=Nitrosarchaeum sp. TaxID=2026886 RepID=UPI00247DC5E7|nr:tyrosine-type recombinase/integrase [Nitrosarchaeum sp.]MCV0411399.1 tyrosine-type recombinase/integrase [Nitrosarchaeum sp.]
MRKNSQKIEVHPFEKKIQQSYDLAKKIMSTKNFDLFQRYDMAMIGDTIAIATRHHQLSMIIHLTKQINKDWESVTKDEIDKLVYNIMKKNSPDGKENWTTWDNKKILRVFMRWLKFGNRNIKEVGDPDITSGVKMKKVKNKLVREDLLTDEDISKIISATTNPRDRALLAVQAEAGTRPGEILSLRIKHIKIDQYGAKIAVDGKTGARAVRIVKSVPDLMHWIDIHPFKDDGESPLWIVLQQGERYGKALDWSSVKSILNYAVKKSGIKKRVYLNLFRHSSATKSAQFMTESQLRMRQGWTPSSTMPATYVHMIGSDADNAYLQHLGIKTDEKKEQLQRPKMCYICKYPNSIESEICHQCGKPLDLEIATKLDERNQSELGEMIKQAVAQEIQRENHYLRNRVKELESKNI